MKNPYWIGKCDKCGKTIFRSSSITNTLVSSVRRSYKFSNIIDKVITVEEGLKTIHIYECRCGNLIKHELEFKELAIACHTPFLRFLKSENWKGVMLKEMMQ